MSVDMYDVSVHIHAPMLTRWPPTHLRFCSIEIYASGSVVVNSMVGYSWKCDVLTQSSAYSDTPKKNTDLCFTSYSPFAPNMSIRRGVLTSHVSLAFQQGTDFALAYATRRNSGRTKSWLGQRGSNAIATIWRGRTIQLCQLCQLCQKVSRGCFDSWPSIGLLDIIGLLDFDDFNLMMPQWACFSFAAMSSCHEK